MVRKAAHLLGPGESAIAIYTNGTNFKRSPDGSGSSSSWPINKRIQIDKVIIYHADKTTNPAKRTNRVYTANLAAILGPVREARQRKSRYKRYKITLLNIECRGTSDSNWPVFADTRQWPIRYIKRPRN